MKSYDPLEDVKAAYARGIRVQAKGTVDPNARWFDITDLTPDWHPAWEYRIAPMTLEQEQERDGLIQKFNCADITSDQLERLKQLGSMVGVKWVRSEQETN